MWSNSRVLLFIEDLQKNECLWNRKDEHYSNHSKKIESLEYLSKKYELNINEVEKKIRNLKCQFRREYKKLSNSNRCGSSKASWFGYEPLLFLLPEVESSGSRCPRREKQSSLYDQIEESSVPEELSVSGIQSSREETTKGETPGPNVAYRRSSVLFRKSQANDAKNWALNDATNETEALKCMKTLIEAISKRDEFSVYGEHIANKLRNSRKSHREIAIAQNHIDRICFNLIMGTYCEESGRHAAVFEVGK
ncbi:uncharacterized protein LOC143426831 [Xylocopa sonorina]|uniref:uncharacterized protein LOC143426831 n=1 Tax=Xylocopa sonorina TaxID=1818115 RepID=UPI00403AC2E1